MAQTDSADSKAGLIVGSVLGSLCLLSTVIYFCYYHRTQILQLKNSKLTDPPESQNYSSSENTPLVYPIKSSNITKPKKSSASATNPFRDETNFSSTEPKIAGATTN